MPNAGTLEIRVKGVPFPIQFADWTHDSLYHTIEWQGGDTQELQAFIGGVGATIPGGARTLTEVDTNIPRSGDTGLQEGWEALVYSIRIEITREMARATGTTSFDLQDSGPSQLSRPVHVGGYDPAAFANGGVLFDFMRKTYHRFTFNQKLQSEGPIDGYPQGRGIHVFSTMTDMEVASNGPPSPRDQVAFVLPIWIKPNVAYVAKLRPQVTLGIIGGLAGSIGGYFDWASASPGFTVPTIANGFDMKETLEGLIKRPVA